MAKGQIHEETIHDDALIVGSDRKFGLVMVVAFGVVGLLPLLRPEPDVRTWALIVAGVFGAFTLIAPRVLHPLNVVWMRFAWVLNKIVSPVVLGVLFFATVLPMGLLLRARGKDLLRLKLDRGAPSYWIARNPPGPEPATMKDQF